MPRITNISQEEKEILRRKSVLNVSNNPNLDPNTLKRMFVAPILDSKDSLLEKLERVIDETNNALDILDPLNMQGKIEELENRTKFLFQEEEPERMSVGDVWVQILSS